MCGGTDGSQDFGLNQKFSFLSVAAGDLPSGEADSCTAEPSRFAEPLSIGSADVLRSSCIIDPLRTEPDRRGRTDAGFSGSFMSAAVGVGRAEPCTRGPAAAATALELSRGAGCSRGNGLGSSSSLGEGRVFFEDEDAIIEQEGTTG